MLASGLSRQLAVDLATGLDDLALGGDHGDDADEFRLSLPIGHVLGVFQQQHFPVVITHSGVAAVTGGVDAGRAVQCVHSNTAVVSQGGQSAGLHDGLGLDQGILLKGGSVLLHIDVQPQLGL